MQSLDPARGPRKRRTSQRPLRARGITVTHDPADRMPVPVGGRVAVKHGPRTIQLGRAPGRFQGKWVLLTLLFIGVVVAYGAITGGQTGPLYNAATNGLARAAVAVGFGVERVTVEGQQNATDAAITTALAAGPDTLMLTFDTDAAKARLEAVPWIRHARVMRLLPSTIQVVVEEREPFAMWQNKGKTYVVDDHGIVLAPALPQAYPHLPLVVGVGAAKHAAELYATLDGYGALKQKMLAALRVGDRRWTLKLRTGAEILLPDHNIDLALVSLTRLQAEHGVLDRDIAAVDLRLQDRITLRMHELAAVPPRTDNPSDVPTAATGSTPKKADADGAAPQGRT